MPAEMVIDIGHSRVKWGRVVAGELDRHSIATAPVGDPARLLQALGAARPRRVLVSGQSRPDQVEGIAGLVRRGGAEVDIIGTGDRPLPVAPAYAGLGCDRWLALQWPRTQACRAFAVVDCGTAITVDLVDADGRHRGGWIMAGIESSRRGLFDRAPGLDRTLPEAGPVDRPAQDTAQALARGELILAAGGIDRAVRAAEETVGKGADLWLTGGDAERLEPHLARPARYEQHLVLLGLTMAMQWT